MVGVDNMTAPEFRRQGLFTTVGRFTYETWRTAGIPFVLGLPNQLSGARSGALGLEEIFPTPMAHSPTPTHSPTRPATRAFLSSPSYRLWALYGIAGGIATYRPDETVLTRRVDRAGSEFDVLWQTCRADRHISAIRDSAWVNWRYVKAPTFAYRVLLAERRGQPVGYCVYRLQETAGRKLGFIAELLTPQSDTPARSTLIARTLQQLRAEGAEAAITLAIPNTSISRAFRRAGFIFSWGSFKVYLAPLDPALPMDTVRDPQNWCMAGGDFDII